MSALVGGDPAHNAAIAHRVLDGEPGPARDVVVLNAAAALQVAGAASGIRDGLDRAADAIDSGGAATALEKFVKVSRAAAESERG